MDERGLLLGQSLGCIPEVTRVDSRDPLLGFLSALVLYSGNPGGSANSTVSLSSLSFQMISRLLPRLAVDPVAGV